MFAWLGRLWRFITMADRVESYRDGCEYHLYRGRVRVFWCRARTPEMALLLLKKAEIEYPIGYRPWG